MNASILKETPDVETASDGYARRFAGAAGRYLLAAQDAAVRTVLHDWRGGSVLDVGGGHAQLTPLLRERARDVLVFGSDVRSLERVRTGDFRRVAGYLDLGQPLAADAALNCYWLADLAAGEARLGDRGYRALQLAAAIAGGRVYLAAYALALGATGLLNCLDPADGKVLWSRNVRAHADAPQPQWGFSSSPLVAAGVVVVYAGGPGDKGVVAYRAADGQPAWNAPAGPHSYASAQLLTLHGREQLLFLSDTGLTSRDPATGQTLWEFAAPAKGAPRSIHSSATLTWTSAFVMRSPSTVATCTASP